MGKIETTFDLANDLTLVKGTGKLTAEDLLDWMKEFYPDKITALILWDETETDLSGLDAEALQDIAQRAKQVSDSGKGGQAAVVYGNLLEYGIGRMFQAFCEIEGLPYEVQSFQDFEAARVWLGLETPATEDEKFDDTRKIIQKTITGELYTERSLSLVRELAMLVKSHQGYNVLLDMRATVTKPEMLDLLQIASACAQLRSGFNSKAAILIPETEERIQFARLFKSCMETQGFRFNQFFEREAALDWLAKDE